MVCSTAALRYPYHPQLRVLRNEYELEVLASVCELVAVSSLLLPPWLHRHESVVPSMLAKEAQWVLAFLLEWLVEVETLSANVLSGLAQVAVPMLLPLWVMWARVCPLVMRAAVQQPPPVAVTVAPILRRHHRQQWLQGVH